MNKLLARGTTGPEVVELRNAIIAVLGEDASLFDGLDDRGRFDENLEAAVRHWQANVGLVADGIVGPYCQALLGLLKTAPLDLPLRTHLVQQLFPATKPSNIARYLPYVAAALAAEDLTTKPFILAALATIRAETEGFVPISEFPSRFNTVPGRPPFSAYEGKKNLGNTKAGDGACFRGRGFVQLTGRANYEEYAKKIGVDIASSADLANCPEIAALLLAMFLADRREPLEAALLAASPDFKTARALVNGGSHGLDRFENVFELAEKIPWKTSGEASAKKQRAQKSEQISEVAAAKQRPTLSVTKDPVDLRDRVFVPAPVGLPEQFPTDKEIENFVGIYTSSGLILDQGEEGACTGFGLACVVNYLRWRKADYPSKFASVSPRMLYNFARRYDEYAGEDYEGSSCRGALKGWFNHGVCFENDWPYLAQTDTPPKYGYATRAARNTLGVYYRIEVKSITDMQAAIREVGAIYVSAFTHEGWQVPTSNAKLKCHADLASITFDGKPSKSDGHAFALVGFNCDGFVVQNSWGTEWGCGGFAVLSYADWLANGMDAWVVALGVPGVLPGQLSAGKQAGAGRAAAVNRALWWDEARAYEHCIVTGNDGRVQRYLTQDEMSRSLLFQACVLPDQWFRTQAGERKRLVIYAHGGLNDEAASVARARALGRYFIGNDCYPLFLVWKTGLFESISDIFADRFRREPARAGGIREALADKADLVIEQTIGRPAAKPIWSEMKENAELCCTSGRGGDLLVTALQKLVTTWGDALEIHVIGHSAGSIILGHLIDLIAARQLGKHLKTAHLLAPACTVQFANRHYAPHEELMARMYLHILSDRNEKDDNVAAIYRKSLLYFVSNALESDVRTPLLGMQNVNDINYTGWDGSSSTGEALTNWRSAVNNAGLDKPNRINVVSVDKIPTAPGALIDASHGSFDNNVEIMNLTIERIIGKPPQIPVDDLRGF